MKRLQKCCCCDLKTGAYVIGWLGLICGIMSFILSVSNSTAVIQLSSYNGAEHTHSVIKTTPVILGRGIIEILINGVLLWGIRKANKIMLLPWLIFAMISIVLGIILILGLSIFFMVYGFVGSGIAGLCFGLPIIGLYIYFWACILCLYKNFRDDEIAGTYRLENMNYIESGPYMPPNYPTNDKM